MNPTSDFRFDEADHSYWLNSQRIPSATQILKLCGVIDDRFYTETSRNRGKAVHAACHYLAEGDLDRSSLDPRIAGYLPGYEKAVAELGLKIKRCEFPLYHPTLFYGVTPDQEIELNEKEGVLELKTGKMMPWTALQTAMQLLAIWPADYMRKARIGLELHEDGTYRIEHFRDTNDFNTAMNMIGVAHYKLKHGGSIQ